MDISSNLEQRIEKIENYLRSGGGVQNTRQVVSQVTQNIYANQVPNARIVQNVQSNATNVTTKQVDKPKKTFSNKANEYWPQIVNELKQNGKIVLYTNLVGTKAQEINDMVLGIEFPNGMTSFGKTILEKPENVREISNMVSMACGKEMQIRYINENNTVHKTSQTEDIQNLANESDIPFNIIE